LEGWDKVYKEMVEDAVHTLTSEENGQAVMKVHQEYSQKRKERCMPNYKKVLDSIQKQLPVKMSFQTECSEILTSFFAWKENFASPSEKSVLNENLKVIKTMKVSLRPGRRWYRDQVPPKMKKVKKKKIVKENVVEEKDIVREEKDIVREEKDIVREETVVERTKVYPHVERTKVYPHVERTKVYPRVEINQRNRKYYI
jgi:hypothetical protein